MILGILQARMSSTRLPGKVLRLMAGKPMIQWEIEKLQKSKRIDKLIIATSINESDDPIVLFCKQNNIEYYRGCLTNVLDRYYNAALQYSPDYIVRITGDCPLIDPILVDIVVDFCIEGEYDYASNTLKCTYPDGLDVEVFTFTTLKLSKEKATSDYDKEHVTPYIKNNIELFKLGSYENDIDLSFIKLSVDTEEDFNFVENLYNNLEGRMCNKVNVLSVVMSFVKVERSKIIACTLLIIAWVCAVLFICL